MFLYACRRTTLCARRHRTKAKALDAGPENKGFRPPPSAHVRNWDRSLQRSSEPIRVLRPTWLPQSIPELNGIRGIAVLCVVLYHCKGSLAGTPLFSAVKWGWTGVDLFFVLS